jgi:hypothetical protein
VHSVAYKNKSSRGEPAEWVTIAPVAEAIDVLERLSARSAQARGVETLWPVLSLKNGTKDHVSAEIVRQLNTYRDHLNVLFGAEGAPVIPPAPGGAPWRITTRQFRRTIAWHIANRPFGTIAGTIQYKHASVAAFEGYAGSSKSGFRAEVKRNAPSARSTTFSIISTAAAPVARLPVPPVHGSPGRSMRPPSRSALCRR